MQVKVGLSLKTKIAEEKRKEKQASFEKSENGVQNLQAETRTSSIAME